MTDFGAAPTHTREHAAALLASGWKPETFEPGEVLGTMSRKDDRQHVHSWTWKVSWLMELQRRPVPGEVSAGNPSLRGSSGSAENTPRVGDSGNGILARISGQLIAQGSKHLPQACEAEMEAPRRMVTLDVPDIGTVTVAYQLNTYRHGKSRHWHWLAVRADLAT